MTLRAWCRQMWFVRLDCQEIQTAQSALDLFGNKNYVIGFVSAMNFASLGGDEHSSSLSYGCPDDLCCHL